MTRLKAALEAKVSESGLEQELTRLKSQLQAYEAKTAFLEDDLRTTTAIAEDVFADASLAHDELVGVSEELAALYHHLCIGRPRPTDQSDALFSANGETPSRVVLEHAQPESGVHAGVRLEQLKDKLHYGNLRLQAIRPLDANLVDTVRDQLKHLKAALDSSRVKPEAQPSLAADVGTDDLEEQVVKYKSLLSTKREQIATLRTVLKANKQTAEVALANLKSKYETEKAVVTETMTKLRNELKALKEDAATFASLRSMFAARCEDYVSQIDELNRQFRASEDEKKTLNSLLRIAIQQKLGLTQKLEELEMDRERLSAARPSNGALPTNWRGPTRGHRPTRSGNKRGV